MRDTVAYTWGWREIYRDTEIQREREGYRPIRGMSTPYMAFASMMRTALFFFGTMWLVLFCATRACDLHEAYVSEMGRRIDEKWLLSQCDDPEFYANMKQHSTLCTQVRDNARANLWIRAMGKVALKGLNLCGRETSCTDLAYRIASRIGWQATAAASLLLLAAPNLIVGATYAFLQLAAAVFCSSSGGGRKDAGMHASVEIAKKHACRDDRTDACNALSTSYALARRSSSSSSPAPPPGKQGHCIPMAGYGTSMGDAYTCTFTNGGYGGSSRTVEEYSPVMRLRKKLFFNDAISMQPSSSICSSSVDAI